MNNSSFQPEHINATAADLAGNQGLGRYVFLPGSDGRAKQIAASFHAVKIKRHPRSHNLYLGTLQHQGKKIAVAAISTGMGSGSMDIIVNELHRLGVKRFLRVGTAGTLQPERVKPGDLVLVNSAVRDEVVSRCYVPVEYPAVASLEMITVAKRVLQNLTISGNVHVGIVHCKASLFGREFAMGPMSDDQFHYMEIMRKAGVLASEMETSPLFVLSNLFDYELMQQGKGPCYRVLSGALVGIVGDRQQFAAKKLIDATVANTVYCAIEIIKQLAVEELAQL